MNKLSHPRAVRLLGTWPGAAGGWALGIGHWAHALEEVISQLWRSLACTLGGRKDRQLCFLDLKLQGVFPAIDPRGRSRTVKAFHGLDFSDTLYLGIT